MSCKEEFTPKKLVLKLEDAKSHATFLDLNLTISNGKKSTSL